MTTPGSYYSEAIAGANSGRPGETPSLQAQSQLWSSRATAASTTPISVEQQTMLAPGNGRSAEASGRVLPGGGFSIPATNGSSAQATEAMRPLQLIGAKPLNGSQSI
jgi:hypothetical protein